MLWKFRHSWIYREYNNNYTITRHATIWSCYDFKKYFIVDYVEFCVLNSLFSFLLFREHCDASIVWIRVICLFVFFLNVHSHLFKIFWISFVFCYDIFVSLSNIIWAREEYIRLSKSRRARALLHQRTNSSSKLTFRLVSPRPPITWIR